MTTAEMLTYVITLVVPALSGWVWKTNSALEKAMTRLDTAEKKLDKMEEHHVDIAVIKKDIEHLVAGIDQLKVMIGELKRD
jgi:hypothetical protein